MKAWVLHGKNDIRLEEVPMPQPKSGEVLVQVKAVGICTSDISRVYGDAAYHYPIILGHEFAGVTPDGSRVGVFPLIPCKRCAPCRAGRYETCLNYGYIGSRQNGAYAEHVAVPKWNLIALPDSMTYEQAALLEPAAVALHAVRQRGDHDFKTAAVIGNGTIGGLIGAELRGCGVQTVDVLGRGDRSSRPDYAVCFEAAGTYESFCRCIQLVRPNGTVIIVGNPDAGFNMDRMTYWQILRKQITVKGTWNSRYPSEWKDIIEHADKCSLDRFISHKFEFDALDKALELLHSKRGKRGKVIITL